MVQKSGVHQLMLVNHAIIYKVLIHPRWFAGFLPSTVCWFSGEGGSLKPKSPPHLAPLPSASPALQPYDEPLRSPALKGSDRGNILVQLSSKNPWMCVVVISMYPSSPKKTQFGVMFHQFLLVQNISPSGKPDYSTGKNLLHESKCPNFLNLSP